MIIFRRIMVFSIITYVLIVITGCNLSVTSSSNSNSSSTSVSNVSSSSNGTNNSSSGNGSSSSSAGSSINSSSSVTTPPAQPTGLIATAGAGVVQLSWNTDATATSYSIYRSTNSGITISNGIKITNITGVLYNDASVNNGTNYYFIVTGLNSGGESPASAQVNATPLASLPPTPPSITVTPLTSSGILVTWPPVTGASSYNLYWSTSPGQSTNGTKIPGITSPYTNTNLVDGTIYYYVATAQNINGQGMASTQASAHPEPYIYAEFILLPSGTPLVEKVAVYNETNHGSSITNDTVTINGMNLYFNSGPGDYETNGLVYSANLPVTIDVLDGGIHYTASGTTFISAPVVSTPASNAIWDHTVTNSMVWSGGSPTAGQTYVFGVAESPGFSFWYYGTNYGYGINSIEAPFTTTSVLVPPNNPTNSYPFPANVLVGISTPGIASGADGLLFTNALPHSSLYIGAVNELPITIN